MGTWTPADFFLLGVGGQAQKRPSIKIKKAAQMDKELAKGPHVHGKKGSQYKEKKAAKRPPTSGGQE